MRFFTVLLLVFAAAPSYTQAPTLLGNWKEPGGSILRTEPCGSNLCLRLVFITPGAPSTVDIHNPDVAGRNRPLCGLVIGTDFVPGAAGNASGGKLYDPKSGHTYHGTMSLQHGALNLRGYVGTPLFGRTETWQRFDGDVPACTGSKTY